MLYFAYGSNMATVRLRGRVPSARPLAVATLTCHRLAFHKIGSDGSAKCDVVATGSDTDRVYGVVFDIDPAHKPGLDAAEGLGVGYAERHADLVGHDGAEIRAFLYYATRTDPALQPFTWYKAHVLRGAIEHGLPADYVAAIESIAAIDDHDTGRHAAESAIHR